MAHPPKTLLPEEIASVPHVGRRAALSFVGATVLGAAATAVGLSMVARPALAEPRRRRRSGSASPDAGTFPDAGTSPDGGAPPDAGSRASNEPGAVPPPETRRRTGITDTDAGATADPAGMGRGTPSTADLDSGPAADAVGRPDRPNTPRHQGDSDSGAQSDRAGSMRYRRPEDGRGTPFADRARTGRGLEG